MTTPPDPPAVIDTLRQLLVDMRHAAHVVVVNNGWGEKHATSLAVELRERLDNAIEAHSALQQQIDIWKQRAELAEDDRDRLIKGWPTREKLALQQQIEALRNQRISTRCPSCGHSTLFIGSGGYLTCSWIPCKSPSLADSIESLQSRLAALEQQIVEMRPIAQHVLDLHAKELLTPFEESVLMAEGIRLAQSLAPPSETTRPDPTQEPR